MVGNGFLTKYHVRNEYMDRRGLWTVYGVRVFEIEPTVEVDLYDMFYLNCTNKLCFHHWTRSRSNQMCNNWYGARVGHGTSVTLCSKFKFVLVNLDAYFLRI